MIHVCCIIYLYLSADGLITPPDSVIFAATSHNLNTVLEYQCDVRSARADVSHVVTWFVGEEVLSQTEIPTGQSIATLSARDIKRDVFMEQVRSNDYLNS